VKRSCRDACIWAPVSNYWTAFLASAFIGLFEATLQQGRWLWPLLMPVVGLMGGICPGSQTLTNCSRTSTDSGRLLAQLKVSIVQRIKSRRFWTVFCGSYLIGVVTPLGGSKSPMLGLDNGLAIIVNISLMAALSGCLIPFYWINYALTRHCLAPYSNNRNGHRRFRGLS